MKLVAVVDHGGNWEDFPEFDFDAHPKDAEQTAKRILKERFYRGTRVIRVVDAESRDTIWEAPIGTDDPPLWAMALIVPAGLVIASASILLGVFLADNGLLIFWPLPVGILPISGVLAGFVMTIIGLGQTINFAMKRLSRPKRQSTP